MEIPGTSVWHTALKKYCTWTTSHDFYSKPDIWNEKWKIGGYGEKPWAEIIYTWSDVGSSPGFVEKMAGEGGRTDDQKAGGHHGNYPQEHQDCPETTVNWRPHEERRQEKTLSFWT